MNAKLKFTLALAATGVAGMLVAMQSRINGGLAVEIGSAYLAALVSFGTGLVIIGIALLSSHRARAGLAKLKYELATGALPKWTLLGGFFGAVFVLGQGLVAPLTGLALFTVGIVAGQVLGGLVIDRLGLGPGGRINITLVRLLGTLLAIVAVGISVLGNASGGVLALAAVPVIVGALISAQTMMNGLLRAGAESAITATFVSFAAGTAALLVVTLIAVTLNGWPIGWPSEPWYYVGGALGTMFIALAAVLVRTVGVLLLSMANVAGQMIGAVLIDVGLPFNDGLTPSMLMGALVALGAVIIAALPSGRPASSSR